jgi:polyisoprenoid-binding protein YceI
MSNYLFASALSLLLAAPALATDTPASTARYSQAATGNSLTFTFTQLNAASSGQFRKFTTELVYDAQNLAGSSLNVKVDIGSLDTQDDERDSALQGAELLNAAAIPAATYVASSLARTPAGGIEAVGRLTLRGVSKDLRLPLTLKPTATGLEISGQTAIKRLDYGVGQGEWRSTESVGDEVKIQYKVALVRVK